MEVGGVLKLEIIIFCSNFLSSQKKAFAELNKKRKNPRISIEVFNLTVIT